MQINKQDSEQMQKEIKEREEKESEILMRAGATLIDNFKRRGHREDHFGKKEGSVNKTIWLEPEFILNVVFESQEQKYEFLNKLNDQLSASTGNEDHLLEDHKGYRLKMVSGIALAKKLGIELKREKSYHYPEGDDTLAKFVLDDETL